MVDKIHYRWDFIGLSTDTKPTPATNDRVANGSTFYCSDNSKLYVWYKDQWYEKTVSGGGGGGGGTSNFNELSNRPKYNGTVMTGSTDIPEVKTYTAGSNVSISSGNVISAIDTTYSNFTGTDGTAAGSAGLVPAPATTDAGKFLKADGTWDTAGGGSITPVQTIGSSTTDVMSQNATSRMVYTKVGNNESYAIGIRGNAGPDTSAGAGSIAIGDGTYSRGDSSIAIGLAASVSATGSYSTAIGNSAKTENHSRAVAIGNASNAAFDNSVALGTNAKTTRVGEVNVGADTSGRGYNSTNYRVIGGVHDGQLAQDAATVGQLNARIIQNAGTPTTATVGSVGQLLEDTTNGKLYQCTSVSGNTYTWTEVGAGGGGGGTPACVNLYIQESSWPTSEDPSISGVSFYKDNTFTSTYTLSEVLTSALDSNLYIVTYDISQGRYVKYHIDIAEITSSMFVGHVDDPNDYPVDIVSDANNTFILELVEG